MQSITPRQRLLGIVGLAICGAACSSTSTTTPTSSYVAAVPYTTGYDYMLWDYGVYDTYYFYSLVSVDQILPGVDGGLFDGGLFDGGLIGDGSVAVGGRIPRPFGSLLSSWGAHIRPSCVPNVDFVDADGDGIPASYQATFNCTNQVATDRTTTVPGTLSIVDLDDHSPTGGVAISFQNLVINVVKNDGTTRLRTIDGTAKLTPGQNNVFQATQDLKIGFTAVDVGQPQVQGTLTSKELATFTPDTGADAGAADPFASGTVSLSGTSVLDRNFQGAELSREVTRSTNPPLHWSRACRMQDPTLTGYDSGTLLYQDNAGSSLTLQYNGCAAPTTTAQ